MMKILLTNDDGIDAAGLKALGDSMPEHVEAVIVAPADEKSACGHSISLGLKLRVEECAPQGRIRRFAVHGTPADCVKFAISELKDFIPDLIISGINQGANTGVSVYYSGTISAAREGQINRIPSIAISLCSKTFDRYDGCLYVTRRLIDGYAARAFPKTIMLNVNVPAVPSGEIRGIKVTKQAVSRFIEEFIEEQSDGNVRIYSLAGEIEVCNPDGTSDEEIVADGFIAITPLKLDLTDYGAMPFFADWFKS